MNGKEIDQQEQRQGKMMSVNNNIFIYNNICISKTKIRFHRPTQAHTTTA
jgi:hypothetical protein